MPCGLFLVKNFLKNTSVFYWVDGKGKKVSPILTNQPDAENWWKLHMFSQYEGKERRKSVRDRRNHHTTRDILKSRKGQKKISPGRRVTDQPISVDIDLFKKKLEKETAGLE